jgi:hypothetical protein
VSAALLGLLALVLAGEERCLLRDPAVLAPPALLGPPLDGRGVDLCPPDRVRAGELPLRASPAREVPGTERGPYVCEHDGCWAWAGVGERGALIGAAATLEVWSPMVGRNEHSLAELSVRGGPDLREILEIGWTVSPRHRADGRPILLVQRWVAGRLREGSGGLHPWSSAYAPGMDLSAWIGHSIRVGWLLWEGRWWAWFEGSWIGWYGGEEGIPFEVAGAAQWFGEVFFAGALPALPMGNGRPAEAAGAARFRELCTIARGETRCAPPRTLWPRVTDRALYGLAVEASDRFRYGGPGGLLTPRPPPSSASGGTPPGTGRSGPSRPR